VNSIKLSVALMTVVAMGCGNAATTDAANDAVGCAVTKPADYDPKIDVANFVTKFDNKFYPVVEGSVAKVVDPEGNTGEFSVTSDTMVILGVTCRVIHDVAKTAKGDLLEDTLDWVAQDKDGNVWYFGEDTKEYANGKVISTEGSWKAGVDCAKPGILMKAHPQVGDSYREEYHAGDAEDQADVLSLDEHVEVPNGSYDHCLKTKNYTVLAPGMVEEKYYCDGVGEVLAQEVVKVGMGKREELVSRTMP
jgi:hypothetical protein